jgi:hypothetical protein
VLDCTKEKLENAPGFDKDRWPDMASPEFGTQIHNFYGTTATGMRTSTGSVMGAGTSTMQSSTGGSSYSGGSTGSESGGKGNY